MNKSEEMAEDSDSMMVVMLGKTGGKMKYTVIDEEDAIFVKNMHLQALLNIDPNGTGACIVAWISPNDDFNKNGQCLHVFLWEKYCGKVESGYQIVHRNGITVDNRKANLVMLRFDANSGAITEKILFHEADVNKADITSSNSPEVYSMVILQAAVDPLIELLHPSTSIGVDANCGILYPNNAAFAYYECHYPPCCRMENFPFEFSVCGNCQFVRYCGVRCQKSDWFRHGNVCRFTQAQLGSEGKKKVIEKISQENHEFPER